MTTQVQVPASPVVPAAPVIEKPAAPVAPPAPAAPTLSGRELLKQAKGSVDYTEDFEEPKPAAPAPAAAVPPPAAPVIDPKQKELDDARQRERILAVEAARAQAQRDLLLQQAQQASAPAPEPEVDLVALMATDPLQAMQVIAERAAKAERERTLQEIEQKEQQTTAVETLQNAKQIFANNLAQVYKDNPDLNDANSRLSQIYVGLEKELPFLLSIPEGPLKALEIAKQRFELEQFKAGVVPAVVTPSAIAEAEKKGKAAEAERQEAVRIASMVAGPSRGTPPSTSVQLSKEQEYAARKLRLTPEQYASYLKNTPLLFKKEESPRRKR